MVEHVGRGHTLDAIMSNSTLEFAESGLPGVLTLFVAKSFLNLLKLFRPGPTVGEGIMDGR
jgi:hypothetical protein